MGKRRVECKFIIFVFNCFLEVLSFKMVIVEVRIFFIVLREY